MSGHSATTSLQPKADSIRIPAAGARKYLYAIIYAKPNHHYGTLGVGQADVYTINEGRVAAVVSDVSRPKVRAERCNLAAHREVLQRLMEESTPLPIAFGTIADGPEAIRKMLSRHQQAFLKRLSLVTGKIEMGLRVVWDVPNIFEYFLNTHPELRAARDRFFGNHREPTQEEKLTIGRLFDDLLQEDRESCAEKVETVLSPHCAAIKRNKCRHERDAMNLACLLERNQRDLFEASVFEAAKLFDNQYMFDFSGPWPPYNFVEIELEL